MPGSLQYKLLQFETPPPPEAWNNINLLLNAGSVSADVAIQQKLYAIEMTAPASAWEIISAGIASPAAEKRTPVIPVFYKRLSVAVMAIAAIGLGVLYFINGFPKMNTSPQMARQDMASLPSQDTESRQALLKPVELELEPAIVFTPKKIPLASNRLINKTIPARNTVAKHQPPPNENISYAVIPAIQSANMAEAGSVQAPPIRDKNGNIIMDLSLVSAPNSKHIVVTGPNGEQTRLSNKFLHCISYLNGNNPGDASSESKEWKTRFQEWREQLLREAAFIPSATNFFDILELKDMIQEK